jgi:3-hydroxyacyl-[acyl-carrier-protein] dehydratase
MILKDTLYSINSIQVDGETIQFAISIDPKHAIFDGHFPGNPVTPGVVQMEIIKELLSTHFQRTLKLKTMNTCKFLAILNPQVSPEVQIKITLLPTDSDSIKISGVIVKNDVNFLKIQAEYC